jgi:hypothetical protein
MNQMRVRFEVDGGNIRKFTVQLECSFEDQEEEWVAIIRYDTAHGFAHCDVLHPYKDSSKAEMQTRNYNEALTFAVNDLATHWLEYRRRYESWIKKN